MKNQIKTILNELLSITKAFEKETTEYLNSFETQDFFTFSNEDEKRKKHLNSYNRFCVRANSYVQQYEPSVSKLSSLICQADKECNNELTKMLSAEFDRYTLLFKAIKRFISNSDKALLNKELSFKQSILIQHSNELLNAITFYKDGFRNL